MDVQVRVGSHVGEYAHGLGGCQYPGVHVHVHVVPQIEGDVGAQVFEVASEGDHSVSHGYGRRLLKRVIARTFTFRPCPLRLMVCRRGLDEGFCIVVVLQGLGGQVNGVQC